MDLLISQMLRLKKVLNSGSLAVVIRFGSVLPRREISLSCFEVSRAEIANANGVKLMTPEPFS